jgi:hypothetical protein
VKLLEYFGPATCKVGIHDWIAVPVRSITTPNNRQLLVIEGRCKRCGMAQNDFR